MLKVNLDKLNKMTNYGAEDDDDPNRKVTGNFALYSALRTKSGAAVYFEVEPRLLRACRIDLIASAQTFLNPHQQ